jgi:NAD(P)H-dependent flavin oxidoreductase YrpB (nitropropane dioxygenase family)
LRTKITEVLGIRYPITQGGMQWVGRAELAAAVSNAGALGTITALTQPTPDDLFLEIKKLKELTDQPFAVNLTFLPTLKPIPYQDYLAVIIDSGVKIVETAGNNPVQYMPSLKAAEIKVIHKCTSVRHALKAESIGVDIVSIDGFECAGHIGEDDIPALILIPAAVRRLKIPVIASGGFSDGKGLVAALALGAEGINMGTRFMCTKESMIHENVKNAIVAGAETDTCLILRSLKNSSRVAKTELARSVIAMEKDGAGIDQLAPKVAGAKGRGVYEEGNVEGGIWTVGMVQGLIEDIPSCQELIGSIISEAESIITKRLSVVIKTH